ncbi:hypothetical protein VPH35_135177 [Triticum aestivum]
MVASLWFFFWLASLGALQVFALSIRLLANLVLFLRRPKDLRCTYGAWAVVTGPTSGIGHAMSLELARSGLNLVLVGRDPTRLREISETISRTYAMQTKTVLFDFSLVSTAQGDEAMSRLREAVAGLNVGVLVNNAGVAKPGAVYLHEVDVEAWVRMIRVNVLALTEVTAEVLPGMVRRGRGAVVNIGSGSGSVLPSHPLYSVYVATKRYVAEFSKSLSVEYQSACIDVQCQITFGFVVFADPIHCGDKHGVERREEQLLSSPMGAEPGRLRARGGALDRARDAVHTQLRPPPPVVVHLSLPGLLQRHEPPEAEFAAQRHL